MGIAALIPRHRQDQEDGEALFQPLSSAHARDQHGSHSSSGGAIGVTGA
jgi:hypothetical protein